MLTRYKQNILFILFSTLGLLLLEACGDECEDCEPAVVQPSIAALFINQDSLMTLNVQIDSLDSIIGLNQELLSETNAFINILVDSLTRLENGLDTGNTDLEDLVIRVEDQIDSSQTKTIEFDETIALLEEDVQDLGSIVTLIESGNILVSRMTNLDNQVVVNYEDSSTQWSFPVDLNVDLVRYEVVINENSYDVSIGYEREQDVNFRREVILRINNIEIINYSGFDTVTLNEKKLTLYF